MIASKGLIRRLAAVLHGGRPDAAEPGAGTQSPIPVPSTLRFHDTLWWAIVAHVSDPINEQAGAILIRAHRTGTSQPAAGTLLTAVGFLPVTEEYVISRASGLDYDARFHLAAARAAAGLGAGMMLIHPHHRQHPPVPSQRDRERGSAFLAFGARRLPDAPRGLMIIGADTATAIVVLDGQKIGLDRVTVTGTHREHLPTAAWDDPTLPAPTGSAPADEQDRQVLAFGAAGIRALTATRIAVVGVSGGGSHVAQQLIHASVGTLITVDDDTVDKTNVRRVVMSIDNDIDHTHKVDLPVRLAAVVHGGATQIIAVPHRFPTPESIAALRTADIIIGCVDGWDVRDDLNTFALEHRIPYIDIGATIVPGDHGPRVSGQIAVVLPGGPCLRCTGLVTDARVQQSRRHRQGYLDNVPEPQVVSVNGTLASEAVSAALLLAATPDAPIEPLRTYRYPPGKISVVDVAPEPTCTTCQRAILR
jgi:molybdopterin/thiamine biosynthesis adenylyltransferase